MLPAELRSGWYLISGIINALFGIYLISGGFAFLPLVLPITIGIWMVIEAIFIFIKSRNADSMVSLWDAMQKMACTNSFTIRPITHIPADCFRCGIYLLYRFRFLI